MKKLVLAGTTLLLSVALMGCGNTDAQANNDTPNNEPAAEQNVSNDDTAANTDATDDQEATSEDQDATNDDNQASDEEATSDDTQASDEEATGDVAPITENNLDKYTALIGMTQDEVNVALDEEDPATIDEGGLNYIVPGVRVWMTKDGEHVDQVFTNNYSADFNGAHIGKDVQVFIDAFGEPTSNENGTAEFALDNGLTLQANYDEESNSVVAVYIVEK